GDGYAAVVHLERVGVREPGVRERVSGIEVDRLLEEGNRFEHAFLAALVPTVAALQVERVGREVVRIALRRGMPGTGQQGGAEQAHDGRGNLVLTGEHV